MTRVLDPASSAVSGNGGCEQPDMVGPPRGDGGEPAVPAAQQRGRMIAIARPPADDAAARRKAALHALRFAFQADVTSGDGPSMD